jgi:hypothetical protein
MAVRVDFLFVFDATSSMARAIQAACAKIISISTSLQTRYSTGFSFQYGAVAYRDQLDDGSTTLSCPFNANPEVLRSWLTRVTALGGGDVCEDWVDAMNHLFNLNWRENALRCVFWIADAPAHGVAGVSSVLSVLSVLGLLSLNGFDNHPDQDSLLMPSVVKLTKMKMVFIGLDLGIVSLSFNRMKDLYPLFGGPSFMPLEFLKPVLFRLVMVQLQS